GPRDAEGVLALREQLGEREVGRGGARLPRDLFDPAEQPEIVLEIALLEARMLTASVVFRHVPGLLDPRAQEATPDGRVGDEGDAELAARGDCILGGLAIEQRVLALHGADGVAGLGAPA